MLHGIPGEVYRKTQHGLRSDGIRSGGTLGRRRFVNDFGLHAHVALNPLTLLLTMREVFPRSQSHPAKQTCKASNLPLTLHSNLHVNRDVGLAEKT